MENNKLAKVGNFSIGSDKPEPNKSLTRTGIQNALAPMVHKVLSAMPGYDPMGNVAHARRTLRAMMIIAIHPLVSLGAPKEFLKQQLMEALDSALEEHAAKKSELLSAPKHKGKSLPSFDD